MRHHPALVFLVLSGVVALFQLALAAGMPWGHLSMGGKFPGRYPPRMRAVCGVFVLVIGLVAAIVLTRAGIIFPAWFSLSKNLAWGVVAYCSLGFVMNVATPSKWERVIWAPVAFILLVCSTIVAMG